MTTKAEMTIQVYYVTVGDRPALQNPGDEFAAYRQAPSRRERMAKFFSRAAAEAHQIRLHQDGFHDPQVEPVVEPLEAQHPAHR